MCRYLFVALTATLGCLLCVVYVPPLQWVFQTEALHASDWLYLVGLASTVLLVSELRKFADRRQEYAQGLLQKAFWAKKKDDKEPWLDAV